MELIAHRAGNAPERTGPALAVADAIELDVHRFRGRLEVRHSKVLWPFAVYWDRGRGVSRHERPPALGTIIDATPVDAHLWIDLKGASTMLTRRVMTALGDQRPITMSSRSWWALRPGRGASGIRTFRSVGNRWQLWLALRLHHPDGLAMHERFARPEHLDRLRGRCTAVAVWAVCDLERAIALRELGVSALIIDDLDLIRRLRDAT